MYKFRMIIITLFLYGAIFCKFSSANIIETDCPKGLECEVTYSKSDSDVLNSWKLMEEKEQEYQAQIKSLNILIESERRKIREMSIEIDSLKYKNKTLESKIEYNRISQYQVEVPIDIPLYKTKELSPRTSHIKPRKSIVDDGFRFKDKTI